MVIGAKRVDCHAAGRKRIWCTVSPVRPFQRRKRGRHRVDLGRTKGALILSREPNLPTEKCLQKETSLSSMAIEHPNGRHKSSPGGNQRPECGKCVWGSVWREVQEEEGVGGLHKDLSTPIGPVSDTALKGS